MQDFEVQWGCLQREDERQRWLFRDTVLVQTEGVLEIIMVHQLENEQVYLCQPTSVPCSAVLALRNGLVLMKRRPSDVKAQVRSPSLSVLITYNAIRGSQLALRDAAKS